MTEQAAWHPLGLRPGLRRQALNSREPSPVAQIKRPYELEIPLALCSLLLWLAIRNVHIKNLMKLILMDSSTNRNKSHRRTKRACYLEKWGEGQRGGGWG